MTEVTWPYPWRGLLVAVVTAILGPPIGNAALWMFFLLPSTFNDGISALTADGFVTIAAFLVYTSVFAFVIAGYASVMAGIGLGLHTARHGTFSYARAMATGALAMCAGILFIEIQLALRPDGQSVFPILVYLVPLAALAAAICRFLFARVRLISPR